MKGLIVTCFVVLITFFGTSSKEKSFKIVLLPDTQHYSESYPEIFYAQAQWIAENPDSIAFVLHQGDITNHNTSKEWEVASGAMSLLDGKVPYVVCIGNHDYGTNGANDIRNTEPFNTWFPYEKYSKTAGFGGAFEEGKMDNVWYTFKAGGINWLILSLEFGPRNKILDWASEVVKNHPSHKVIINTHAYMYSDDTRMSEERGHHWLPMLSKMNIGATGSEAVNNGEQMWKKFVSQYPNILMVVSGHVLDDGVGTLVSEGKHGNKVYQMLANYQKYVNGSVNGGNGFFRILTVNPGKRRISVRTYSPYLNEYITDPSQQFEFEGVLF
ncbi:MAG: metallophosphatase [Bacteroidetes bacterium GWF2_42_66]|nr:MAG: metallophosphatase [Bacteroidetes bacterium GWA2_42_15]OFY02923.1 MAG: metallophosphatase [Bacteroidetes bacterium GWE2_42_39]OFY44578.1 MAG: metallophosphatase [Bacteroidetes bacterium GWF2_42_66]HAZ04639.1 metallophosphatase [Marinilabiliales bacterium]HBL74940.1 metallophosphatase [Prolixibacteraceae bacterium]